MKFPWSRRRDRGDDVRKQEEALARQLSRANSPVAKRARRMRHGQDVEFEQTIAQLRNKQF